MAVPAAALQPGTPAQVVTERQPDSLVPAARRLAAQWPAARVAMAPGVAMAARVEVPASVA